MSLGQKTCLFKEQYVASEKYNPLSHINDYVYDISKLRQDADDYFNEITRTLPIVNGINIHQEVVLLMGCEIRLRIYIPQNLNLENNTSAIVFHPGGGLLLNMQNLHDRALANLAKTAKTIVISIQPPLASDEHKLLQISDIAYQATYYCYENATQLKLGHIKKLIVAGYSMGAILASLICNRAVKTNDFPIAAQLLISGVFNLSSDAETINAPFCGQSALDFMSDTDVGAFVMKQCLPEHITDATLKQPEYSPYYDKLSDLPPTILIAGGCDSLMPSTVAMHKKMEGAGVSTEMIINDVGDIHNTFLLWGLIGDGQDPAITAGNAVKKYSHAE